MKNGRPASCSLLMAIGHHLGLSKRPLAGATARHLAVQIGDGVSGRPAVRNASSRAPALTRPCYCSAASRECLELPKRAI